MSVSVRAEDGTFIQVRPEKFPDGTWSHEIGKWSEFAKAEDPINIMWKYENEEELSLFLMTALHFTELFGTKPNVVIPYIPNARMDRVELPTECFTLKHFATLLNSVAKTVSTLDVHSDVSKNLINNLEVVSPKMYVNETIDEIKRIYGIDDLVFFFPDEGARNRYQTLLPKSAQVAHGVKQRDFSTGKITGLDIVTDVDIKGKNILIIDDISSRGGTFYHSAKKLKELGAGTIFLYVTHCEDTIFHGELLKDNSPIERIFTTDSLPGRRAHSKIETFPLLRVTTK